MRVVENQFLKARGRQAGTQVAQDGHERSGTEGQRARKTDVLVALAVMDRWQGVYMDISGKFFQGVAEQEVINQCVRGQGQMVAVLLRASPVVGPPLIV